jgi:hypothetical protein
MEGSGEEEGAGPGPTAGTHAPQGAAASEAPLNINTNNTNGEAEGAGAANPSYREMLSPQQERTPQSAQTTTTTPQRPLAERIRAGIKTPFVLLSSGIPTDNWPSFFGEGQDQVVQEVLRRSSLALQNTTTPLTDHRFPGTIQWTNARKHSERDSLPGRYMLRVALSDRTQAEAVEAALANFTIKRNKTTLYLRFSRERRRDPTAPPPEPTHQVILTGMPVTGVTAEECVEHLNTLQLPGLSKALSAKWTGTYHNNNNNNNTTTGQRSMMLTHGSTSLRVTLSGEAPKSLAEAIREIPILPDVTVKVSYHNPRLRAEELKERTQQRQQQQQEAAARAADPTTTNTAPPVQEKSGEDWQYVGSRKGYTRAQPPTQAKTFPVPTQSTEPFKPKNKKKTQARKDTQVRAQIGVAGASAQGSAQVGDTGANAQGSAQVGDTGASAQGSAQVGVAGVSDQGSARVRATDTGAQGSTQLGNTNTGTQAAVQTGAQPATPLNNKPTNQEEGGAKPAETGKKRRRERTGDTPEAEKGMRLDFSGSGSESESEEREDLGMCEREGILAGKQCGDDAHTSATKVGPVAKPNYSAPGAILSNRYELLSDTAGENRSG